MTLKVNDCDPAGRGTHSYASLVPGHLYRGKNSGAIYLIASQEDEKLCVSLRTGEVYSARAVVKGGLLRVSGVLDIKAGCCCE